MPAPSLNRIMQGVDKTAVKKGLKGPNDLINEMRTTKADLEKRIARGESGDGLKKADLKAQLRDVSGQLKMFEDYQKNPTPPKE
jgi:hypothetical protein